MSGWKARPEKYPNTVTRTDIAIKVSDGTILRADLVQPADASGAKVPGRWPVVVTITAYNKTVLTSSGLGGADGGYLVKRGYATLTVDARGTGSSEGVWKAFERRENKDAGEIMTWAHEQPWSNGKTAMSGPSYMGISQIFAASAQPPGLKAIFPQVPGADVYRDVVASGGQIDVGFIPLWLGLVTTTGLIPPALAQSEPQSAIGSYMDHLEGALTFTVPLVPNAFLGGEPSYDGPFYKQRSPINVISKVNVPTFFLGGQYDLFQRGTPLLFENLRKRGIPTKMVFGPWSHLQGSAGTGLEDAGYGSLSELQLRWFDHYVKGFPDPELNNDIKPFTYYEQGTGAWRTASNVVTPNMTATSFDLSGSAINTLSNGVLTTSGATEGTAQVLPIPAAGLCTRSASQWTAGIMDMFPMQNPCLEDNALNDYAGVVYESAPLDKAVAFRGPLNARLYVESVSGDGMLSVAVEDVAPDGTVHRITGGWQVISFRELDKARSRYLDGTLIQAFHPFTKESKKPLTAGVIEPVDVEIFPTAARILPGHRLRLAIALYDTPHLFGTVEDDLGNITVLTIHTGGKYRSTLSFGAY
jgi:hypothetical protein